MITKNSIRTILMAMTATLVVACAEARTESKSYIAPKREFRGAWIQAVNGQWQGVGRDAMQRELIRELNALQADGINAILFQVRVEGDALYASNLEPWSRYLTGTQGTPPNPYWDPLEWMVRECHSRGMELHAWINPYRAKTKGTTALATTHQYIQHPDRCFKYDNLLIFDPGEPKNREFICNVVRDIVQRYDIDGLHIDDYFYPYPVAGVPIPDGASYARYGNGMNVADWRRENVNTFIREMHETIHSEKPWVKFGVSPFGIYRNRSSWEMGSDTNGTQNYDDLYADVLEWVRQGWVDYNIPQIYWEIGNRLADYKTLIRWWNHYAAGRPLYIGQDAERTVKHNQFQQKYDLQRSMPAVQGSCQWYARYVADDTGNYGSALRTSYHRTPALQPLMPWIDKKAPGKPRKLKDVWTSDGYMLFWTAPKAKTIMDAAHQYVVYRFAKGQTVDIDNPAAIVAITRDTWIRLPYANGKQKFTYVVTALDRLSNESSAAKKTVKL